MKSILLALIGVAPLAYVTFYMWTAIPEKHEHAATPVDNPNIELAESRASIASANAQLFSVMINSDDLSAIRRQDEIHVNDQRLQFLQKQIRAYDSFQQMMNLAKSRPAKLDKQLAAFYDTLTQQCTALAEKARQHSLLVDNAIESELRKTKINMESRRKQILDLLGKQSDLDVVYNECDKPLRLYNSISSRQPEFRQKYFAKVAAGLEQLRKEAKKSGVPLDVLNDYENRIALMDRAIKFREEIERQGNATGVPKVAGLRNIVETYKEMRDRDDYSFKSMYLEVEAMLNQAEFDVQLDRVQQIANSKTLSENEVELLLKRLSELRGHPKLKESQYLEPVQQALSRMLKKLFINPDQYEETLKSFVEFNINHKATYKSGIDGNVARLSTCYYEYQCKEETKDLLLKNKLLVGRFKFDPVGDKFPSLLYDDQVKEHFLSRYNEADIMAQLSPWSCIKPAADFQNSIKEVVEQSGRMLDKSQWASLIAGAKQNQSKLQPYLDDSRSTMIPKLRTDVNSLNDYYTHVIKSAEALTHKEANWKLFESFYKTTSSNSP